MLYEIYIRTTDHIRTFNTNSLVDAYEMALGASRRRSVKETFIKNNLTAEILLLVQEGVVTWLAGLGNPNAPVE